MGDEQLVDQAGVDQLGMQAGPALAEQGPDPTLGAQVREGGREVDAAVVADDANRRPGLGGLRLRAW